MNQMVSIVTPTMPKREYKLLNRCIPSVRGQDYDGLIQHVIVSDRNPGLRERVLEQHPDTETRISTVVDINDTWLNELTRRCTGSFPWRFGGFLAHGDYVGFLGDDDEYLSPHVKVGVTTMEHTGADFSLSQVAFYGNGTFAFVIGDASYTLGHLDSTGIMCRREALRTANWDTAPMHDPEANAGDYRMVRDWINLGLRGEFIPQVTGNHHDGWLTHYAEDQ